MARVKVPVRKPPVQQPIDDELGIGMLAKPIKQFGNDIAVGSRQLSDLFSASTQAVKSGYRKVKSFLDK